MVLIKPTPDINRVKFDVESGVVDRASAELEINQFDLYAVETALIIKETLGGLVTAVSMAPPQGERALREAIARGVDRAILLTDRRFAGADTLATSYTLAAAVRKLGRYDLILCGEKSVDGDTAHVGPEVAEYLGVPHAAFVTRVVDVSNERIVVESDYGDAYYLLELRLPALISLSRPLFFSDRAVEPRTPKLSDVLRARKTKVEVWNADHLIGLADPEGFGLAGSATRVVRAFSALERGRNPVMVVGDEGVDRIIEALKSRGLI
ncbi:MAG: electron transfer flavoprotein subunit beta/FixA family protein [Zestosphaera sp.]